MSGNSGRLAIRYDRYRMNIREILTGAGKGAAVTALLAYTFYRNLTVWLVMLIPGMIAGVYAERKRLLEKRLRLLSGQFKESMMILAGSLSAGYSIENALYAGVEELGSLYGKDGLITAEFRYMTAQIRINRPVEQVLEDFANRSGIDDIRSFAEVFSVAKRSSGDLGSIMRHTAEIIRDKMQVKEEIRTMTAAKVYEQKIMNLIPFFIVFYVDRASPGFFGQMYGTVRGRGLMTLCMLLYGISYVLAKKILEIEV